MGVTLKATVHHNTIGYGGFARLRQFVADTCSKEFGAVYAKAIDFTFTRTLTTDEQRKAFEDKVNKTIKQTITTKQITPKIVKFLFQSDTKGRISYGTCKEIIAKIKDVPCDDNFGYIMQPFELKDFINLLEECCNSKQALKWD